MNKSQLLVLVLSCFGVCSLMQSVDNQKVDPYVYKQMQAIRECTLPVLGRGSFPFLAFADSLKSDRGRDLAFAASLGDMRKKYIKTLPMYYRFLDCVASKNSQLLRLTERYMVEKGISPNDGKFSIKSVERAVSSRYREVSSGTPLF